MDGLTFPLPSPAPGCALGGGAAPEQRAGDGPEHFTALNLCWSRVWSKAAIQNPPLGNEGFSHLRIRTGKKERERENEEEEKKEKNKGKIKSQEERRREKVP